MKKVLVIAVIIFTAMSFTSNEMNKFEQEPPSEEAQGFCHEYAMVLAGGEGGSYEIYGEAYDDCLGI